MGYFSNADIEKNEDSRVIRGGRRSGVANIRDVLISNGFDYRAAVDLEKYLVDRYGKEEAMDNALSMYP